MHPPPVHPRAHRAALCARCIPSRAEGRWTRARVGVGVCAPSGGALAGARKCGDGGTGEAGAHGAKEGRDSRAVRAAGGDGRHTAGGCRGRVPSIAVRGRRRTPSRSAAPQTYGDGANGRAPAALSLRRRCVGELRARDVWLYRARAPSLHRHGARVLLVSPNPRRVASPPSSRTALHSPLTAH